MLMETRALGSLQVSIVGLGCNNFGRRLDEAGTKNVVDAALDAGINFFDTADIYGDTESERLLGRVLRGRRERVLLATKFGLALDGKLDGGAHPATIAKTIHASLKRLQMDHVDLYQLHTPDASVPIAETLGALGELVQAGWVREIGCSNFNAAQLREAHAAVADGSPRFVSLQNEYSLMKREDEADVLPTCRQLSMGYLPYFPLMSGLLSGKYRRGMPTPDGTRIVNNPRWSALLNDANLALIEALATYAEARGYALIDLAFAWLLARPEVSSVIAGAMSAEQVRQNARTTRWTLRSEERAEVDAILAEHPMPARA